MRLDLYLTENGLARSRGRAKELIEKGLVAVEGVTKTKASYDVQEGVNVTVQDTGESYVGRGLLKLEAALDSFRIDVSGKVCADIGASTGGFTQCLLRHGASLVYAVDVGHGQLAEELLTDSRVVNMEGYNARELDPGDLPETPEIMSADLSFISLSMVMPAMAGCLAQAGEMIVLIKPQFEAGRSALNKHGIVTDKKTHVNVLTSVMDMMRSCGMSVLALIPSPITGGSGNIEYLAHLKKQKGADRAITPASVVEEAFGSLKTAKTAKG